MRSGLRCSRWWRRGPRRSRSPWRRAPARAVRSPRPAPPRTDTSWRIVELNVELDKTILMVTHDPAAADRAARIVQLDKGRLLGIEEHAPAAAGPDRMRAAP